MKLEALEHINIDHFDRLVRDRCLDVETLGSLANIVGQQSNVVRRNLEIRASGRNLAGKNRSERFEVLVDYAVLLARGLIQSDANRLNGETFYLEGLLGIKEHFAKPLFLGEVEITVRKNPKIDVTDNTGKIINENSRVRLSSAMLLFGAIASAARISMRTAGEEEAWNSNLDMAVGVQYALNQARENVHTINFPII